MYAYLKGTLVSSSSTNAIVDVNGIGYCIQIPCSVIGRLPHLGSQVQFYTSFVVRELSQTLYGFLSTSDRDAFEILLGVTGIGPKTALSLIGHLSISELQTAISQHNLTLLSKVPGIGKKTAERLVIELRDKLSDISPIDQGDLTIKLSQDPRQQQIQDAMMAMMHLGYNQNIAKKAIAQSLKDLPEAIDLATLITCSLKNI